MNLNILVGGYLQVFMKICMLMTLPSTQDDVLRQKLRVSSMFSFREPVYLVGWDTYFI